MNDMRRMRPAGYVPETRNGRTLHRVRVEGEKRRRITIPVGPEDPAFWEHYYAARAGQTVEAPTPARAARTLATMCAAYLAWLDAQVAAGTMSSLTLIQRRSLLGKVCAMPDDTGALTMGDYDPALPPSAMLHIQDQWGALTGQADNSLKALSSTRCATVDTGALKSLQKFWRLVGPEGPPDRRKTPRNQSMGVHRPGQCPAMRINGLCGRCPLRCEARRARHKRAGTRG